jgi:hypothetical protein
MRSTVSAPGILGFSTTVPPSSGLASIGPLMISLPARAHRQCRLPHRGRTQPIPGFRRALLLFTLLRI